MVIPTSTQLARTEPATMTFDLPFDDESYSEYKAHSHVLTSAVECFTCLMVLLMVVG